MSSINYDLTKIKAFALDVDGVLSPSTIPLSEDGQPLRMVNIKDGYAIQLAVKLGFKFAIITGGKDESVKKRFESLGIKKIVLGASEKLPVFTSWLEEENLDPENVAYMGDDIPDLKCLRHAGLPCSPYDAAWECKQTALYVSRFSGGYGCVRDVVEQVLKSQNLWLSDEFAFGW